MSYNFQSQAAITMPSACGEALQKYHNVQFTALAVVMIFQ